MSRLREHWLLPEEPFSRYDDYLACFEGHAVPAARASSPAEVLREVGRSGLRGRGGAGFPTATKWTTVAQHEVRVRQVVCNAAEGEPATFKDRWLLRHNPYAVLEGMLIAAHAVGASELFVGIKASFEKEIARLEGARDEMEAAGLLEGLSLEIVAGPEEYLFGEERALLEVLEGGEPLPREAHYPPYEKGLRSRPAAPTVAVVNNAETFAHVPGILRAGGASFRELGTEDTPGTLLFTLCGDVQRPGVYEREAGIRLRELFEEVAGGPRDGRRIKAALPGVSAAPITPERFGARADFGSLALAGSALGAGGFWILDDAASMPRVLQSVARFLYVESCNQCSACKHGLRTASEAIDELFDPATASDDDVPRALYGARSAPQGNRCFLPVGGSILVPALIDTFADELDAQLRNPEASPEPVMLPKIVDYDPEAQSFSYDEHQPLKTPDWTYEQAPRPAAAPAPVPRARPAPRPHDADRAPVVVRLASDVAPPLEERALAAGQSVEAVVNEALRAWLRSR